MAHKPSLMDIKYSKMGAEEQLRAYERDLYLWEISQNTKDSKQDLFCSLINPQEIELNLSEQKLNLVHKRLKIIFNILAIFSTLFMIGIPIALFFFGDLGAFISVILMGANVGLALLTNIALATVECNIIKR